MSELHHYVLDGKIPRAVELLEWARWFEKADRKVAKTNLPGGVRVSTVFLGLDHQWGDGPPEIFETMIFGGPLDQECWRCSTWEEAERQHESAVLKASASQGEQGAPVDDGEV